MNLNDLSPKVKEIAITSKASYDEVEAIKQRLNDAITDHNKLCEASWKTLTPEEQSELTAYYDANVRNAAKESQTIPLK